MSNRDIGNLYHGIYNGDTYNTPKREKDLYNSVISRNTLNEATVTIKYSDGDTKVYKDIPDETARTLITSNDLLYTLPGICKTWVKLGGWSSNDGINVTTNSLIKIFRDTYGDQLNDPEIIARLSQEVKTIINIKQANSLNIFNGSILANAGSGESFEVFEIIKSAHAELEMLTNDNVLMGVHNIVFSESNVNVGAGEVLITLYTEAVNPDEGDLMLPDGTKVELKAGDGRPGKAGVYSRIAKFENYIKSNMKETYETEMINTVNNVKSVLIDNIGELLAQYDPKRYTDWPAGEQKHLAKWHAAITGIYNNIIKAPKINYDQLGDYLSDLKMFYKTPTSSTGKTQTKLYEIIKDEIPEILQWLLNLQTIVTVRSEVKRKPKVGDTVMMRSHFAAYDMTVAYSGNLPEGSVNSLVDDIATFSMNGGDEAVRATIADAVTTSGLHPSNAALKIIGAIQIVDYGLEDGFDYFMLMVDPRTGSKSIMVGPMGSVNYTDTLRSCIEAMFKHDAHVLPDTGGRGKNGYNVGIK